jgi:hypothetical protein
MNKPRIRPLARLVINFLLFMLSHILFTVIAPLTFFYTLVFKSGRSKFLLNCAYANDQSGNVFCHVFFNSTMRKKNGYRFGKPDETISSVLGKLQQSKQLTLIGKLVCFILDTIDPNHCKKSIESDE